MKNHKNNQRPAHLKRRLYAALCMLLVSSLLVGVTSYAWLVMSVAPEVSGMSVNVGANGALEIALLNTETRQDMSAISSIMGSSLANRDPKANNTWGNTIDLSYADYGLQNVVLWPSRLNLTQTGTGYVVGSNLLSVPTYGYDGRIVELTNNTVTGTYNGNAFSTMLGQQDFGVRVIGTTDLLSPQSAALALAKSNIRTYMSSANQAASAAMDANGNGLLNILLDRTRIYNNQDLDVLKQLISDLGVSVDYIEQALRQGILAFAASQISDVEAFEAAKVQIMDSSKTLSQIVGEFSADYFEGTQFASWISKFEVMHGNLNAAKNACNMLTGGSYVWAEFRSVLDYVMNIDTVYINDDKLSEFDASNIGDLLAGGVAITLAPGSGVFADVADFVGDFSSWVTYGVRIEIKTLTLQNPVYLQALYLGVSTLEAADGSSTSDTAADLTQTFGYVVDMAFRTNAAVSNLLLQTAPSQRVYADSDDARTMGGGSYMEFTTDDETLSLDKMIELMDAVRVGFVNDQGNLLGIAKLNTSNRVVTGDKVKAALYLYGFHIDPEDGSLQMDERQKSNNILTALEQDTAKAISVVVWLDGDLVDNTKVSATYETSLKGTLNLQFASNANLVPAGNNALRDITADKNDLETMLDEAKVVYDAGQGLYTTVSWNAYCEAYAYANAVFADAAANENQIYNASLNLALATQNLESVSHDALSAMIAEIRELMGTTTDLARYVMKDQNGNYYTVADYTEEQADLSVGQIYRVDYAMNLHDEGNGIKTPIYTDESWSALAAALYEAEAVNMNDNATDAQIDAVLTALQVAHEALARKIFYLPYDYEGELYYFALTDEEDTYGKWYYNDFTRVVSDLLILKLDAKAEQTVVATLFTSEYVSVYDKVSTAYVELRTDLYSSLSSEKITGIAWNALDNVYFSQVMGSKHEAVLTKLVEKAKEVNALGESLDITYTPVDITAAQELLERYTNRNYDTDTGYVTTAEAETAIDALQTAIADAQEAIDAAGLATLNLYMTAEQRTLLTAAINAAKTVDGYNVADEEEATEPGEDNPEGEEEPDPALQKLENLRNAVAAAEALLASDEIVTAEAAEEVLNALNEQLVANGKQQITVYNTIVHSIPIGSEIVEIVNAVELPGIEFMTAGKTGTTTVGAIGVTNGGVVFAVSEEVTVYTPATDAIINDEDDAITVTMTVGETVDLQADLAFNCNLYADLNEQLEKGNIIKVAQDYIVRIPETVHVNELTGEFDGFLWSSDDSKIVRTSGSGSACAITAVSVGTTYVRVSIETAAGNTYATWAKIVVNPA